MRNKFLISLIIISFCTLVVSMLPTNSTAENTSKLKGESKTTIINNKLKLMTFNIRAGCGRASIELNPRECVSTNKNLDLVAMAIKSEDPDIVALQEVKGYHQAKHIAEILNMNYTYINHNSIGTAWWGLAILSKYKIHKTNKRDTNQAGHGRIALISEIIINNRSYHFVNVHYFLGNYESQVYTTMEIVNEINGPVVLLGDFNRRWWDIEMMPIQESFIDTCDAVSTDNSEHAKAVGTGFGRIDYIFVQDKYFFVLDAGIYSMKKYREASDHYAYYTLLKFK
jgi:endonuclease/exonuclease/phosphatase family metal-dependent hydrolase